MNDHTLENGSGFRCRHTYLVADVLHELEMSYHFTTGNILNSPPDVVVITDEDSGHGEGAS